MTEKRVTISDGILTAEISNKGAQIKSMRDNNGKEYIWCGDSAVWDQTTPIMFPICGGLKDGKYIYDGKEYSLAKHGFTREREFEFEKVSDNEVVLKTGYDDETLKMYPFKFEFKVTYTLSGGKMNIAYTTINCDTKPLYYSDGGHEAYACDEGIEAYDIVFEKEENLIRSVVGETVLLDETEPVETDGKVLHMKYSHMENDCLCFKSINSRSVKLINRETKKGVQVDFEDFKHFVLWTKMQAKYLCIEPWNGLPDFESSSMIFEEKIGIMKLEEGETKTNIHTITPIM